MNHGMRILELERSMILSCPCSLSLKKLRLEKLSVEIREIKCLDGYQRDGQEIFETVEKILN